MTTVPKAMRYFVGQIKYVQRRNFDVHVITSQGESLDEVAQSSGAKTHVVSMSRAITPFRDFLSLCKTVRTLRVIRPHIVHAHTPKAGYLGMLSARLARVPVKIYHIRGLRFETTAGLKRKLLKSCEKLACSVADEVLCVSHSIRQVAIDEGLVPAHKIKVLLNGSHGLDSEVRFNPSTIAPCVRLEIRRKYNIPDDATVIGFVGRLVRDKGVTELVQAFQQLTQRFSNLYLLAVGPLEPEDPVPHEVRELLQSHPQIRAIGSNWDTPPLYTAMDVVCLPTYREGLPRVPLEAASMQLPVVATDISGCIDAVRDGENGLLVPPRDADALANALETYLMSPELRKQHGHAGRSWVAEAFSPQRMCEAVLSEYQQLLGRKVQQFTVAMDGHAKVELPARAA